MNNQNEITTIKDTNCVKGLDAQGSRPLATEVVAAVRVASGEVLPLHREFG